LPNGEIDLAEPEAGRAKQREAERDQVAIVHFGREVSDRRHRADCSDAARTHGPSSGESGIAHQLLIEQWKQSDEAVDAGAEQADQQTSDGEIAVPKDFQIHMGGSTVWVFSTTLLQLHTEDRFRGRVFSADLGFSMLTIAAGAFLCGRLLDAGISARAVATGTGLAMLIPAALWSLAMREGKQGVRLPVSGE